MADLRRGGWALLLLSAACALQPYDPLPLTVDEGLPADAFERCYDVLRAQHWPVVVADAATRRLQTQWTPVSGGTVTAQQRATIFPHREGLGLLVEVRYLRQGWFDRLPEWTSARVDRGIERELGDALLQALRAKAPSVAAPPPSGDR